MISELYCTFCGNKLMLPRPEFGQREKNHIKTMYCFRCNKDTPHLEIRDIDGLLPSEVELLKSGILSYYFTKYGYDFLKALFFLKYCESYFEFSEVVNTLINTPNDMKELYDNRKILTNIAESIENRHNRLYNRIIKLLKSKTLYFKYYD